jgi:hypothetical protein
MPNPASLSFVIFCFQSYAQAEKAWQRLETKNATLRGAFMFAVREGFEPSVQLPVRQFSKLVLSASQAPHLYPFFQGTANVEKDLLIQNKKRIKYILSLAVISQHL